MEPLKGSLKLVAEVSREFFVIKGGCFDLEASGDCAGVHLHHLELTSKMEMWIGVGGSLGEWLMGAHREIKNCGGRGMVNEGAETPKETEMGVGLSQ